MQVKIYDKESRNYVEESGTVIPVSFTVMNGLGQLTYDESKYEIECSVGLPDKNGKLLFPGDIVEVCFETLDVSGMYMISNETGQISFVALSEIDNEVLLNDIINGDVIVTYVTSYNTLTRKGMRILKCNCPMCLSDIFEFIHKDSTSYYCKKCGEIIDI